MIATIEKNLRLATHSGPPTHLEELIGNTPLLRFDGSAAAEFFFGLRWEPQTYVCWDNRICVHQAFNDCDDFRRELYRTTIAGETPA